MDRTQDCGSCDPGSIPGEGTNRCASYAKKPHQVRWGLSCPSVDQLIISFLLFVLLVLLVLINETLDLGKLAALQQLFYFHH